MKDDKYINFKICAPKCLICLEKDVGWSIYSFYRVIVRGVINLPQFMNDHNLLNQDS